jgi:hypothetical protein
MSSKKADNPNGQHTRTLEPDLSSAETYHQGDDRKHARGSDRLGFADNGGEVWPASAGYGVETVMPRVNKTLMSRSITTYPKANPKPRINLETCRPNLPSTSY